MNKRQRKKQEKLATIAQYQAVTGMSKRQARQMVQKKKTDFPKPSYSLVSVALAELQAIVDCHASINYIISQYERDVNRLVLEIIGTYDVDPHLSSWSHLGELKQILEKLEYWWDYYGFKSHNQFYKNLCTAIENTGIQFEIVNEFKEIVNDAFQGTTNFNKWVRFVQLEWLDKTDEVFYPSQEVRVNQAYNSMGYERRTLAEMEALHAL